MATARKHIFNPEVLGYYHCIVRCVRRSYLCGFDKVTNKSFEHRRDWIKDRLSFLLDVFAIDCFSYAVMSNHLHMVIRNNPEVAKSWSNEEVAKRWRRLFSKYRDKEAYDTDIKQIAGDQELVEKYRKRLCCISWFNRCMNENIAKRANKEDECTGRFWEGRFTSQKLESMSAVIACGVYVDLNPIRACIAETPEESDYTSIQDRIRKLEAVKQNKAEALAKLKQTPRLIPVADIAELSEEEYLTLVDSVGRDIKFGKRGSVSAEIEPILKRLKLNPEQFLENAVSQSTLFRRVIGTAEELQSFAVKLGQRCVHGMTAASRLFV